MVSSIARSTASGSTAVFSVPFPYLDKTHVQVRLNGVLKTLGVDYTFPTSSTIQISSGNPTAGTVVERKRVTPTDPLTDFSPGNLDTGDLNVGILQPLYLAQEGNDSAADILLRAWFTASFGNGGTITVGPDGTILIWDASGNVVVGPSASDIQGYSDAAEAARDAALAAQAAASGYASSASGSASSASTSATTAQAWAANPEDSAVPGGGGLFSALHYAAKAAASLVAVIAGFPAAIHAATGKATPADSDEFPLVDSAASFALKKITWANIKALLMLADVTNLKAGDVAVDMANSINNVSAGGGAFYTHITATDHNVDRSTDGLWGGVIRLVHKVGGLSMRGYRIAFQSQLIHDQKAQHAENQFVAATFQAAGNAAGAFNGTGLTAATAKGGLFGANSYVGAISGYTNLFNSTSHEFNSAMLTGSSVFLQTVAQFATLDEIQGTEVSCIISIGGAGQTSKPGGGVYPGLKHGILFGSQNAGLPTSPTGILIGDYYNPVSAIPLQAADLINMSNYTFSGYVLKTKGYSISAAGNVEAGNPTVAGAVVYDFHTSGNAVDYDVRLGAAGGSAVAGTGVYTVSGGTVQLDAPNLRIGSLAGFNTFLLVGSGAPESVQIAPVGSMYFDVAGGGSYYKQTGAGNTGWAPLGGAKPVIKTADFTVAATEKHLINNKSGSTCTVTLPAAASFPGRELNFSNYQAQTVVSASSNVVSKAGSVGTAILASGSGQWARLVSDGSSWYWVAGS